MADSSAVLAAARSAQNPKKKVMKGPEIDLDMDALMAGVLGEGDDKKKKKQKEEDDGEEKMHGTASVDAAAKARAHARENVVDELLTEYAAEPHTKVKMKKKKVRRYPCYNFRKIMGCAHVDLHTCVLEGKLGRCRRTLRRLGKKVSEGRAKGPGEGRPGRGERREGGEGGRGMSTSPAVRSFVGRSPPDTPRATPHPPQKDTPSFERDFFRASVLPPQDDTPSLRSLSDLARFAHSPASPTRPPRSLARFAHSPASLTRTLRSLARFAHSPASLIRPPRSLARFRSPLPPLTSSLRLLRHLRTPPPPLPSPPQHAERINEHDVRGRTALSLAVKESREDIADLILSSTDSDPDLRDKWTGMAPLHHAAHLGLTNTVSKIIWRQGDINITDNNGTTPLMMACAIGNERCARPHP
jgi:hypothetical protein